MNLYLVYPLKGDWGCYVFEESRNKAKMSLVNYFDNNETYIDFGCKTIQRDVGGEPQICDMDCSRLQELGVWYNFEYDV
jgi:hypothetical protein